MPRANSSNWSVNDAITAARLQDVNEDLDDIYSLGNDRGRIRSAVSLTALRIDISAFAWRVGSVSGQYAGAVDIVVTNTATNYVEIDATGTIAINTTAWTSANARLGTVTCAGGVITAISLWKVDAVGGLIGTSTLVNTSTMSGNVTIESTSKYHQLLNPNGADRVVTLDTLNMSEGNAFYIKNTGTTGSLEVKQASTSLFIVRASATASFVFDGTNWSVLSGIAAVPTGSITQYVAKVPPAGWLLCHGQAVSRATYSTLFDIIAPSLGTFTVTLASPGVFSLTAHGLVAGDPVYMTTTGALPTGLTANTIYFVISTGLTADTFRVSATRGGAAINTSVSQSGTHTLRSCPFGLGDGSTTFNIADFRGRFALGFDLMGAGAASGRVTSPTGSNISETAAGTERHTLVIAEMPSHTHDSAGAQQGNSGGGGNWFSGIGSSTETASIGGGSAHNNMSPYITISYIIKT